VWSPGPCSSTVAGLRRRRGLELYVAVFVAGAVDSADEDSVGDGVGALGGLPASYWAVPNSSFSEGCQPMAVGRRGSRPAEGGETGAFGYHWSQQTKVPIFPAEWKWL